MASATAETAPAARLKTRYLDEIRPALIERFGYSSMMQAPKLEKITLNMGVGMAKQDSKALKAASEQLATIAGQQPSVRRARKSIAAFKLREGMPVGLAVTLRGERGYEFLDRLISIAIPRIRDFRGLSPRSFDGRGNYSLGVKEQIIFPEVDYDSIDQVRGLDITITTSAATDIEAYALLAALGMPFSAQGRPKGYDPAADEAAARAHEEAQAAAAGAAAAVPSPAPVAEPAAEVVAEEVEAVEEIEAVAEEAEVEAEVEAVAEEAEAEEDVGGVAEEAEAEAEEVEAVAEEAEAEAEEVEAVAEEAEAEAAIVAPTETETDAALDGEDAEEDSVAAEAVAEAEIVADGADAQTSDQESSD